MLFANLYMDVHSLSRKSLSSSSSEDLSARSRAHLEKKDGLQVYAPSSATLRSSASSSQEVESGSALLVVILQNSSSLALSAESSGAKEEA